MRRIECLVDASKSVVSQLAGQDKDARDGLARGTVRSRLRSYVRRLIVDSGRSTRLLTEVSNCLLLSASLRLEVNAKHELQFTGSTSPYWLPVEAN